MRVDKHTTRLIEIDRINHLNLRSDFENNNIYNCLLIPKGFVGNPESKDNTWAIDCETKNGQIVDSYLYASESEYLNDVKLLKI